jgi:hypothetical protein
MWSITVRITLAMSFLTLVMVAACAAQADQASGAPSAGAAGLVVFIDPLTGKLVQPNAEDFAKLSAPKGAAVAPKAPARKAPVTFIYGPGNTVGMATPPESFSYAIVTTTPEGKLTLDCVVGAKAANDRIAAGESRKTPEAKGPLDEKR